MEYRASPRLTGDFPLSIKVDRIFDVRADESYDVGSRSGSGGLVVFRTLSGQGRVVLDNRTGEDQREGSLLLARWDDVTRYRCVGKSWDFLWFRFEPSGSLPLPVNRTVSIPLAGDDRLLVDQCLELSDVPYQEASVLVSSLLGSLIQRWAYQWIRSASPRTPREGDMDRIAAMMRREGERKIPSAELAGLAGLSERRFRTLFRKHTGYSPRGYYRKIRMEAAGDYLSFSSLSVQELAARLGYCDPFHFSKEFKRYYAKSPRQFRRESEPC